MDKNEELQRCINILKEGGLIVAPSDTVYGLICDATNSVAVQKLINVKNRPPGKPISVFCDGFEMISSLIETKDHENMLKKLLPGPFTVILASKHKTSLLLESENKTLGVRFTTSPWIQDLVHRYGKPLTATSANIAGRSSHYESRGFMNELSEEKRKLIDYVVDGGKLPRNKPSTVIDLTEGKLKLLRKGDLLPNASEAFTSNSALETKKIAEFLIEKNLNQIQSKPLVFILEGEMGVGKTVFAQGLGHYLGEENIVSPTYVVYYEYKVKKENINVFLHADLFNIEEAEEFSHLGLEEYLIPKTIMCIEWGARIGPLFEKMKAKATIIIVDMNYTSETERTISVQNV